MKRILFVMGYMVALFVGIVALGVVISLVLGLFMRVALWPMAVGSFGFSFKVWIAAMVVSLFGVIRRNK